MSRKLYSLSALTIKHCIKPARFLIQLHIFLLSFSLTDNTLHHRFRPLHQITLKAQKALYQPSTSTIQPHINNHLLPSSFSEQHASAVFHINLPSRPPTHSTSINTPPPLTSKPNKRSPTPKVKHVHHPQNHPRLRLHRVRFLQNMSSNRSRANL